MLKIPSVAMPWWLNPHMILAALMLGLAAYIGLQRIELLTCQLHGQKAYEQLRRMSDAKNVLLLGCGGGNLATMLARSGKSVTVVDHNPVSFDLAKRFFGMPKEISCLVADFKEYLATETRSFDGIAIDVGGPGFFYEEQFDPTTCHSITARLSPGGRAILNMLVATDFDAAPDLIGGDLSEGHVESWIFDQPGLLNRNVLLVCLSKKARRAANKRYMAELSATIGQLWAPRRPRRPSHDAQPVVVEIAGAD